MIAIDDILTERQASCVCPECSKTWMGPMAAALVSEFGQPDGTVRVWCEECQQKASRRAVEPPRERFSDPWLSLCPDEYRLTTEGGRTERDRLKRAWGLRPDGTTRLSAGQIAELILSRRPVLLAGAPGTMKTRLAWRMVRMLWDTKASVRCFSAWRFQSDIQEASGLHQAGKWMDDATMADLVFIDDLGKAEWTANTHGAFFELFEARITRRKATLITTNETFGSLAESRATHKAAVAQSAAAPLVRRFREYAETLVMQRPE